MLDYACRLLKSFPQLTLDFVEFDLPMVKGMAMYNWAVENDGWNQFAGIVRKTDGPIAQEIKRLMGMTRVVRNGK